MQKNKFIDETRAGVCKTLCPQHMLVPKDDKICKVPKFYFF